MLLKESCFDTTSEFLLEGVEKNLYLYGIFMQADVPNRNKRIYPNRVMEPAVDVFIEEFVKKNRAVGELEHPQSSTPHPDRICTMITEIQKDGSDYIGKAKVLGTPTGQLLRALLEGGVQMGVSSRGRGETKMRNGLEEVLTYKLDAIDVVYAPSAPDAFVSTLVESENFAKLFEHRELLIELDEFLGMKKRIKESKKDVRSKIAFDEFNKLLKSFR